MSGCHQQLACNQLEQIEWYKIRDTLCGHNYVKRDIVKALELASVCEHPHAVWLTKLFAGRDVATLAEARQIFLEWKDNPEALCFAALFIWSESKILQAANLGKKI